MKRLLLDFDGTLAQTDKARYEWMNAQYATSYDAMLQTHWHNEESGYIDPDHEVAFWTECWPKEEFHFALEPVAHAITAVHALRDAGHEAMVVSDRPAELFEVTRDWLDRQGLDMVRLMFTRHKQSKNQVLEGFTKAQAAYLYKLNWVVEDAPHHGEAFSNRSYVDGVYLLDYPYNARIEMNEKIHRVSGWKEIMELEELS